MRKLHTGEYSIKDVKNIFIDLKNENLKIFGELNDIVKNVNKIEIDMLSAFEILLPTLDKNTKLYNKINGIYNEFKKRKKYEL